jgi:Rieske Fe-S protein
MNSCTTLHAAGAAPAALEGVARRTFLIQSAIAVASAALAACGGSLNTAPSIPTTGSSNTITVASYPSLGTVGGVAVLTIGNAPLAIVRTGDTSFLALSRICPHQGGIVQQSGSGFQCPIHGARFSNTGQWTGGQNTSNLHAYATTYDAAAGTLTIS